MKTIQLFGVDNKSKGDVNKRIQGELGNNYNKGNFIVKECKQYVSKVWSNKLKKSSFFLQIIQ